MGELVIRSVAVTTTGGDGAATGTGTLATPAGYLEWVHRDYAGTAPATTDVTLAHTGPITSNIVVFTDTATDALSYPRGAASSAAGAAVTDSHVDIAIVGPLSVSVAGSNALAPAVTVTVCVRTA